MFRPLLACVICLAAALAASAPAGAGGSFGPKVYVAPGDLTPWRRSDSTNLFRDRPSDSLRHEQQERTRARERALDYQFDRLDSRVGLEPQQRILQRSTERDLEIGEQELRSLETQAPNADAIPLLERQLDRLQRPTDLGQ
jgi:hypothetical protein